MLLRDPCHRTRSLPRALLAAYGEVMDLEQEYSPSSVVGGSSAPFEAQYRRRSAAARDEFSDRVAVLPGGTLLVQGRGPDAPLLVFVHGGYWQALSAADSLFPAADLVPRGWAVAAVEYTIAPAGGIDAMVGECIQALGSLGAGRRRVVLVGHSAGAHLVAMSALVQRPPLHTDTVVLVSGIYDLRPLVHTSINAPLRLDSARAERLSPLLAPAAAHPDVVVAWGEHETAEFKRQSAAYADHLEANGCGVRRLECARRNHFDVVFDLGVAESPLGAAVLSPAPQ